jgi:hypothetical protein
VRAAQYGFAALARISKTILARKSGPYHEDRVASGLVMGVEITPTKALLFLVSAHAKGVEQLGVRVADNRAVSSGRHVCAVETGLAGWAYRTRTDESVGQLSDWNGDPARTSCVIRICSSVEISADASCRFSNTAKSEGDRWAVCRAARRRRCA